MTAPAPALVSPLTGSPLTCVANGYQSDDGTLYPLADGIVDMLDPRLVDPAVQSEMAVFQSIPIERVCYFRPILFKRVLGLVLPLIRNAAVPATCVEIGGGEGYFASAFHRAVPGSTSYVCDLSARHLRNAHASLIRVRADVRFPCLERSSIGLAAFWVSLHHFSPEDARRAIAVAIESLAPGGYLLIFEPNNAFLPRRSFYRMQLSKQVYFDEEEKALDWKAIEKLAAEFGLLTRHCSGVNPPYSPAFLKHFRLWPLFLGVTETLYRYDRIFKRGPRWWSTRSARPSGLSSGSYLLSVLQKPLG